MQKSDCLLGATGNAGKSQEVPVLPFFIPVKSHGIRQPVKGIVGLISFK
jgi:hypothetical protein